jgi:hypothetical protein
MNKLSLKTKIVQSNMALNQQYQPGTLNGNGICPIDEVYEYGNWLNHHYRLNTYVTGYLLPSPTSETSFRLYFSMQARVTELLQPALVTSSLGGSPENESLRRIAVSPPPLLLGTTSQTGLQLSYFELEFKPMRGRTK